MFRNLSHPQHSLELKNYLKPYTCDGCKEKGFGPRYRCEKCDFDLHKECMFPRILPVPHEFFPDSSFKFLRTPPRACHDECKRRCDACRKLINGFVYHCESHDLDLHPCCRNLNKMYKIEDVELNLHNKVRGKCLWCNRKSMFDGGDDNGWSYMSKCGKYHVHVACVTEMALGEWNKSGGGASSSSTSSSSSSIRNVNNNTVEQSLVQKLNLNAIQTRGRGEGGTGNSKYWRILKVFIKTIVSIVIGDPTMVLASLFVELLG